MSTSSSNLPTCNSNLVPVVSGRSHPFTQRRALDSSDCLGSFYDACRDQVLSISTLKFAKQSAISQKSPECYVKPCSSKESKNLLKWYCIHPELRLSVTLQLLPQARLGALMNYSRSVDKYTRFVCCDSCTRTDYIPDDEFSRLTRNRIPLVDTAATHVVVLVNWGIDAVAVLQLPHDDKNIGAIDYAINKLCLSLSNKQGSTVLSGEDIRFLEQINQIDVFSNIPELCEVKSILDFRRIMVQVTNDDKLLQPYNYNLCSIRHLYTANDNKQGVFIEIPLDHNEYMQDYLIQLAHRMERLDKAKNPSYPNMAPYLEGPFSQILEKWFKLNQSYKDEVQRIRQLVLDIRGNHIKSERIDEALNNNQREKLRADIKTFEDDVSVIREKESLIRDLLHEGFHYRNANEFGIQRGDDRATMKSKLLSVGRYNHFICFNNDLFREKKSEWNRLVAQMKQKRAQQPELQVIFIDLTYSSYALSDFITIDGTEKNTSTTAQRTSTNSSLPRPTTASTSNTNRPSTARSIIDDAINILLLGESGVGKSTFINALANYLTFNTLQQAEKRPVSLMPVSFIITVGDNFEEKTVSFNMQDDLNNEDFTQPGQSVTQHCKSYVFTLTEGENSGRKIRIIDTPGIGDVRGLAQDDINMQHVLLYITNLTHLNAVCLLMKPNHARLNIYLRSCFVQLFDLLGESARDRMIFCFTNSRSTFYTPGDSGPLIKQLLKSLPVSDILFNKTNSFCFDSESFRYLVAKRNGMKFNKSEEQDYQESWAKSSTESKRFLDYICTKTTPSLHPGEVPSAKSAQLKIRTLVRPMLEAMRNTLRNIVLWEKGSRTTSVNLCLGPIRQPTGICLKCPRQYVSVGDFWMVRDALHLFLKKCGTCQCSFDDHLSIDYRLDFKPNDSPENNVDEKLEKTLDGLCETSAQFANFLMNTTEISKNDPFLLGMTRMINEESDVCKDKSPHDLNAQLLEKLQKLKKDFEDIIKKISKQSEATQLSTIYDEIEQANEHPLIKSQMNAARQWHRFMMKHYEYEVSTLH